MRYGFWDEVCEGDRVIEQADLGFTVIGLHEVTSAKALEEALTRRKSSVLDPRWRCPICSTHLVSLRGPVAKGVHLRTCPNSLCDRGTTVVYQDRDGDLVQLQTEEIQALRQRARQEELQQYAMAARVEQMAQERGAAWSPRLIRGGRDR